MQPLDVVAVVGGHDAQRVGLGQRTGLDRRTRQRIRAHLPEQIEQLRRHGSAVAQTREQLEGLVVQLVRRQRLPRDEELPQRRDVVLLLLACSRSAGGTRRRRDAGRRCRAASDADRRPRVDVRDALSELRPADTQPVEHALVRSQPVAERRSARCSRSASANGEVRHARSPNIQRIRLNAVVGQDAVRLPADANGGNRRRVR